MDRDFLKMKIKNPSAAVLAAGISLSVLLGIVSLGKSRTGNTEELFRNGAGGGSYEQKMIADLEGEGKIPLTVTVEERRLTKAETKKELDRAARLLPALLCGENESLQRVSKELCFADTVPETAVDVEWQTEAWDYFSADMTRRRDVRQTEPVPVLLTAVLRCQEQEMEVPIEVTLFPIEETAGEKLSAHVAEESEKSAENEKLYLPKQYEGRRISWKKPMDVTFLYVFLLTLSAAVLLKAGQKRDEELKKQKEREELERGYAGLVSKFTMLLAAGLSIRNAWERITALYEKNGEQGGILYRELCRSLRELQQGVSELEVYERFGVRTGLVHYKKLMALFISDKRRGSIPLPDALDREMLEAWEEKKRLARQRGEKTETKLLVPMMGMLSVVFLMILIPAFLSFQM